MADTSTPIALPERKNWLVGPCHLCQHTKDRKDWQRAIYAPGCCEQAYCHECYIKAHYQTQEERLAANLEDHTLAWSFFFNFC